MTDLRSLSRGVAAILLALVPAYCSVDGLVTGETLVIDRRRSAYDGNAGLVMAISYGVFAAALAIAGWTYFLAQSKRRRIVARCAWYVTTAATVLYFAGRIMAAFQ